MDDRQFLQSHVYDKLISLENLFSCWDEFKKGKRSKIDVMHFERHLEDNIFELHRQLHNQTYRHGPYATFHIWDPKHRIISKATVRDRLVHHVIFNELYRLFDPGFIYHSYASRLDKGTHLAVGNLARALRKVSRNYTHNACVLKCDIYQFFYSVSHQKLLQIIKNKISDKRVLQLIEEVIRSFSNPADKISERERERESKGMPIGNLSSQIFANIYLNELDQFIKHKLRVKYYFRYADDFVIVHGDWQYLKNLQNLISEFLNLKLGMRLHPNKVSIRKFRQGTDFLGYVLLPHYKVLRTKTKNRMFRKAAIAANQFETGLMSQKSFIQSTQSYFGMLKHCNSYNLQELLLDLICDKEYFKRTGMRVMPSWRIE